MSTILDTTSIDFWKNQLTPEKNFITLTSEQTLRQAMINGMDVSGTRYIVKSIQNFLAEDGLFEYRLIKLENHEKAQSQIAFLLLKFVDDAFDLKVFFEVNDRFEPTEGTRFQPGSRSDMVEREHFYLFQEPSDPVNFDANDLEFTDFISRLCEYELTPGETQKAVVQFNIKDFGPLNCKLASSNPHAKHLQGAFVTLVEYQSEYDIYFDELLLIEYRHFDHEENEFTGNLLQMYQGSVINTSDIEVY